MNLVDLKKRKKELERRIVLAKQRKKRVIVLVQGLVSDYIDRKINYEEYEAQLEELFVGKSAEEWVSYYDKYIALCEKSLRLCEWSIRRKKIKKLVYNFGPLIFVGIFIALLIGSFVFEGKDHVSLAPPVTTVEHIQELDIEISESGNIEWELESGGKLQSVKLSGMIESDEAAAVEVSLVDADGNEFLILDSLTLNAVDPERLLLSPGNETNNETIIVTNASVNDSFGEIILNETNVTIPEFNVTINETEVNVTGNETVPGNISEFPEESPIDIPPEEIMIREFRLVCEETCDLSEYLLDDIAYNLKVEIDGEANLQLESVSYEIVEEPEEIAEEPEEIVVEEEITERGRRVKVVGPGGARNVPVTVDISDLNVKVGEEDRIKIFSRSDREFLRFNYADTGRDGIIDVVQWVASHLSEQIFEIIIEISKAEHLDSDRNFVSDIYDEVRELDGIWSERIPSEDYVRVTFEQKLAAQNDITIFPRIISGTPRIEVYEKDGSEIIAEFESLNEDEYNTVLLTQLSGTQDTFDLKIINGDVEFDHIVDPPMDFKIQRGTFTLSAGSLTGTITEGVDFDACLGDCFVKHVSSRHSGMGRTAGGGNQNFDDFETYISDDSGLGTPGGSVTFERHGIANDDRITWEIWEYTGPVSGDNEMVVLDSGVCTFGAGSTTCDGGVVGGGATDNNDVVVFVTGHGNPDTGRANGQMCWTTSEWVSGSSLPRFIRGETGSNCDVSYAVVEFTGVNWNVQRVPHVFSAGATQTETITSVVDISRAFFHTQQRNNGGNNFDGLCQSGSEVELTDSTTLTYRLPQATTNWGADMNAVTWVVWNTQTVGQPMIVSHYNPAERLSGGSEEDNWQFGITPLTYALEETAITGLTSQSAGCGTNYPRSYINSRLTDASTVDFWQSDSGQAQGYTFQVVEFPTAALTNFPPSDPTEIQCDGSTNCDITVDASVTLEALGSIDPDLDVVTYFLEAFLESSTASGDQESGTIQTIGGLSDVFTPIHFQGWETGVGGWSDPGADSDRSNVRSFVTDAGTLGGAFSWHLQDNTATSVTEQAFDFTGYDRVYVSWFAFYTSIEGTEALEVRCDGNVVYHYEANTLGTEDQWLGAAEGQFVSINPVDCVFDSSVVLRFEAEFSGNNDNVYIDGVDVQGVVSGVTDIEASKPYITYNNIFGANSGVLTSIDVTVGVTAFDDSGSVQNGNNLPDLELEMWDGTGFVSVGTFVVNGIGNFVLSVTNPTVLSAWETSANTDLRIRGINFDYFDASNFDQIDFENVDVDLNEIDWTAIGSHDEGSNFVWNTAALPEQTCINLRTRGIDLLGSNVFSNYFTKGNCLEIDHGNLPPVIESVSSIAAVDLFPDSTTDVVFTFVASDPDGVADLDDLTAFAQFDKLGESTRSNSCTLLSQTLSSKTYTCTVTMQYYDDDGTWDVTASVDDFGSLMAQDSSTSFFVNLLLDIDIVPAAVGFPAVVPNDAAVISLSDTTVINRGNFEVPGDGILQVTAFDLTGGSPGIIPASNFRVAGAAGAGTVCISGDVMSDGAGASISGAVLDRGASGNTEDLRYCLTLVPGGLTPQPYSASGASAWEISILTLAFSIRRRKRKKKRKKLSDKKVLKILEERLRDDYGIELQELLSDIEREEKEVETIKIPLSIFREKIGPAEALCKYLKENMNLKFSEIGELLNRDQRSVWISYRNAREKKKEEIKVDKKSIFVSVEMFGDRRLSILESLVVYFKKKGFSNGDVARILNKESKNVWTLYARAVKKLKEEKKVF